MGTCFSRDTGDYAVDAGTMWEENLSKALCELQHKRPCEFERGKGVLHVFQNGNYWACKLTLSPTNEMDPPRENGYELARVKEWGGFVLRVQNIGSLPPSPNGMASFVQCVRSSLGDKVPTEIQQPLTDFDKSEAVTKLKSLVSDARQANAVSVYCIEAQDCASRAASSILDLFSCPNYVEVAGQNPDILQGLAALVLKSSNREVFERAVMALAVVARVERALVSKALWTGEVVETKEVDEVEPPIFTLGKANYSLTCMDSYRPDQRLKALTLCRDVLVLKNILEERIADQNMPLWEKA